MNYLPRMHFSERFGRHCLEVWSGGFCLFDHRPSNCAHLHHGYHELCLVLTGEGLFTHAGHRYALRRGSLFLSELDTVHEISSWQTRDLYLVFLCFTVDKTDALGSAGHEDDLSGRFRRHHRTAVHAHQHLADYLPLMCRSGDDQLATSRRTTAVRMFVLESLQALSGTPEPAAATPHQGDIVRSALELMERNLDRPVSVAEIAHHCCCSERHLRRRFRHETGTTLTHAMNERRVHLAAQRLLMRHTVEQVAQSLGMSSVAHFSRLFRRHFGISPKQYQMRNAPKAVVPRTLFIDGG